jgi:hypothetical protein
MTEEQKKVITINGTKYNEDQLTDNQKLMINHITDLDQKIASMQFNIDQLNVGKEAFIKMLTDSLDDDLLQEIDDVN